MTKSERFQYGRLLRWSTVILLILLIYRFFLDSPTGDDYHESELDAEDQDGGQPEAEQHEAVQDRTSYLDINYIEENYYNLQQSDPELILYTRARYLTPPSNLEYNMDEGAVLQSKHNMWVCDFFRNKTDGIYIEAGANDGGALTSHTFHLEKELGWTGLLVECNPKVVPSLKSKHRKAWVGSVCLAPTTTPGVLNFSNPTNWTYSGTFRKPWKIPKNTTWEFFDVETLPLYTILAALGWNEIDFFLFDIEGSELSVLKTFPFDEIIFKVLIIEVYFYTKEEKNELDALLAENGYHYVKKLHIDHVYVHNSVKHMLTNELM